MSKLDPFEFRWKCPNCGYINESDANESEIETQTCEECDKEYEIYCDIQIDVREIIEVKDLTDQRT
jgi:peptide subunit release factor 1 (eRF1)